MKARDIKVGEVYIIRVGKNATGVRILELHPYGGWSGVNVSTNKPIRLRTASRIRGLWKPGEKPHTSTQVEIKPADPGQTTTAKESRSRDGSGLCGAIKVLADARDPLGCKEIVARMLEKGYWHSGGLTPWATLYSSILREIKSKGASSRFVKLGKGKFAVAPQR